MRSLLNIILVDLSAYAMGFVAAMPVGATQLEIARRSLSGFRSSALMIVVGSVISDAMYGAIALFGIAPTLQNPLMVALFWSANACILVVLGILTIHGSRARNIGDSFSSTILKKHNVALVTGFSLAITNPLMIFWWLLGSRMLKEIGLVERYSTTDNLLFLLAGSLGIASYLVLLTLGVYKAKRLLSERSIQSITVALGVILLSLATYSIVQSAIAFKGSAYP